MNQVSDIEHIKRMYLTCNNKIDFCLWLEQFLGLEAALQQKYNDANTRPGGAVAMTATEALRRLNAGIRK